MRFNAVVHDLEELPRLRIEPRSTEARHPWRHPGEKGDVRGQRERGRRLGGDERSDGVEVGRVGGRRRVEAAGVER